MNRPTIASLVRELGYCCEARFFSLYRQTGLIAARLGVSDRAVRYRKAMFKAGLLPYCAKCQSKHSAWVRRQSP